MFPLKLLITNIVLKDRGGTEIVTMEMAHALMRRGHEVVVFSPELGASAEILRRQGVRSPTGSMSWRSSPMSSTAITASIWSME